jgi:hypothetical protein
MSREVTKGYLVGLLDFRIFRGCDRSGSAGWRHRSRDERKGLTGRGWAIATRGVSCRNADTDHLVLQPDFVIFMLAWLLRVHRTSLWMDTG